MKSCPACLATYPSHISFCPTDGRALTEFQEWSEGTVVRGKYRILSRVGQGGMGSVYKAVHLGFQELRALKVLNRELMNDPRFPKRFKQEAFTARKLVHPNVVRVEDIDESDDGQPFIAMELVEGENLGYVIEKEGALQLQRTCTIVKQIASALDFAHQLGVIHRDIKPHNIALVGGQSQSQNGYPRTNGEQVKVLDFGIAKVRETYAETKPGTLTQTGLIVGTPQYMSPEQAKGRRGDDLDGRSDIYSLGVVMYQMLTGGLPFDATTTVEMLVAHLQGSPRPLHMIRPDLQIPDSIAEVVMKCLEKNRELRPPTGSALIQAIGRAEEEIAAGPTSSLASQFLPAPVALSVEVDAASQDASASSKRPAPPVSRKTAEFVTGIIKSPGRLRWATTFAGVVLVAIFCLFLLRHRIGAQPPRKQPAEPPSQALHNVAESSVSTPVLTPLSQTNVQVVVEPTRADTSQTVEPPNGAAPDSNPDKIRRSPAKGIAPSHSRPEKTAPSTALQTQIRAAITEGDVAFENGEYDGAISAYKEGLKLDPKNQDLLRRIERTQRAKAAEENANQ